MAMRCDDRRASCRLDVEGGGECWWELSNGNKTKTRAAHNNLATGLLRQLTGWELLRTPDVIAPTTPTSPCSIGRLRCFRLHCPSNIFMFLAQEKSPRCPNECMAAEDGKLLTILLCTSREIHKDLHVSFWWSRPAYEPREL
jgi:hypothetical protein